MRWSSVRCSLSASTATAMPMATSICSEPGIRYDDILLDMVAEVKARWGLAGDRFGLFGFSGGARVR